jgi:hypothetical protein
MTVAKSPQFHLGELIVSPLFPDLRFTLEDIMPRESCSIGSPLGKWKEIHG